MDKLRVAVIGCGGAAGAHAQTMASSGDIEVVGLVDPSESSISLFRQRVPEVASVPAFSSADQLYAQVELDAVTIVTPHTLHYPLIMGAIERGLHVLCEKPMVCEAGHAREIESAAEAAGVTVMVRYQRRFFGAYRYMREAVDSGELGELRSIAIHCGQGWKKGTAQTWRQRPELSGGGMLMDTGSHLTDMLLWLAGRPVESVYALVDSLGTPVDINTSATLTFEGGVQGQLTVLGDYPSEWTETVVVTGSRSAVRYEIDPQHPWRPGRVTHHRDDGITEPLGLPEPPEQHVAWIEAIRGAAPNLAPPSAGTHVSELCEAIYRSAREGRVISL